MTLPSSSALLLPRLVGVLRLHLDTFRAIAEDRAASPQAGLVVVLSGVIEAAAYAAEDSTIGSPYVLYAVLAALIGWVVWSGLLYVVGTRVFEHPAPFDAVLRVVGFAHASTLPVALAVVPQITIAVGSLFFLSLLWFAAMLGLAAASVFNIPPRRAALVMLVTLVGHEVLRQTLAFLGIA